MDEFNTIDNDLLVVEHDCTTNSITERALTDDEIAAREIWQAAEKSVDEAKAAKAAARAALLDKLGITAEEAELLLG